MLPILGEVMIPQTIMEQTETEPPYSSFSVPYSTSNLPVSDGQYLTEAEFRTDLAAFDYGSPSPSLSPSWRPSSSGKR